MTLDGEKVRLRPLRRSDAASVEAWLHDPETTRWMVLGRTAPSAERWVADQADGWPRHVVRAIWWRDDAHPSQVPLLGRWERPIGILGLYDLDWLQRRAELRIVLGAALHRGHGAGTEAVQLMLRYGFLALDLYRIWLGTAAENHAARRCFEKAGFLQEGVLCQDFLGADGRRGDNVRYAILKPRWEALTYETTRNAERAQG